MNLDENALLYGMVPLHYEELTLLAKLVESEYPNQALARMASRRIAGSSTVDLTDQTSTKASDGLEGIVMA
ncbi:hypothetical protein ANO11243_008610 [Dothideomycetidae sp. 11243]|nr:hypothetical protein ANO11243_008610 [fungal sp. No.11243]